MKKRTDLLIFMLVLGLAAVLSGVYGIQRSRALAQVRVEMETLLRQPAFRPPTFTAPEKLVRMFPQQPDISVFVDGLYQHAHKSGIRNLEVQTLPTKDRGPRVTGRKDEKAKKTMQALPLRIVMEGTYRNIAEYMRLMQNDERFTRVVELEIQPGKDLLRATMTLEIFSIAGQNAS
ncbi:MAG: hypothetical protein C0402_00600 [Thermodesulfovibrio sp.]|nr:hypothetical protein [Thermodesulfovibrio sp.]